MSLAASTTSNTHYTVGLLINFGTAWLSLAAGAIHFAVLGAHFEESLDHVVEAVVPPGHLLTRSRPGDPVAHQEDARLHAIPTRQRPSEPKPVIREFGAVCRTVQDQQHVRRAFLSSSPKSSLARVALLAP